MERTVTKRTITIKETANTTVTPDFVILSFTIEATEKNYASAVESVTKKIQQLNTALVNAGLENDSVKTERYNVRPNYSYEKDRKGKVKNVLEGYTCVHRLKTEFFFDAELLSKAIETISVCLADPQMDILFTVKDKEAARNELLKEIATNAKKKAEIMCVTAGAKLGKLITIEYYESGINISLSRPCLSQPTLSEYDMELPSMPEMSIQPNDINMSDSATFVWEIE